MKLRISLVFCALLIAGFVSASYDDADVLPNGVQLPARSRHPISEQRRRLLIDEYLRTNPHHERRDKDQFRTSRSLRRRHGNGSSEAACKAKTSQAAGNKVKATKKSRKNKSADPDGDDDDTDKSNENKSNQSIDGESDGDDKKYGGSRSQDASPSASSKSKSNKSKSSSSSKSTSSSSSKDDGNNSVGDAIEDIGKGLFNMVFKGQCPNPKADNDFPNGVIDFLNCGISQSNPNGKWAPPSVNLKNLKVVSADEAAKSEVFKPCNKYKWAFEQAGKKHDVPPVILMSFAMQESTCNPKTNGGNGEIGMMQITPDKCKGAPNGDCADVGFNVNKGAEYFKQQLKEADDNVIVAIGSYNGWSKGLTYSHATSKQYGCHAQNNLDYLSQMLNGWFQGNNGNSNKFKKFNNLAGCN